MNERADQIQLPAYAIKHRGRINVYSLDHDRQSVEAKLKKGERGTCVPVVVKELDEHGK